MNAGMLRHRVTFQKRVGGVDSVGQPFDDWVDVCTVWACIDDKSGKEIDSNQSERTLTNTTITIRHRKDITSDMRVVHNGIYYDIKVPLEKNKLIWLELECQKGVRYEV